MSVILDAMKTAQREKQERERGISPPGAPIVMPPRRRAADERSWKSTATIVVASLVIVASMWSLWGRMKGSPAPRATVAIAPVPLDSMEPAGRPLASASVPTPAVGDDAAVPLPPATRPEPRRAGGATSARVARTTAADAATTAPLREPIQSGRLRIAVEQPREGDAARLFAAGVAAHRGGDLPAARAAYERVLAIVPSDVDALNNLGVVLAATRELEPAEAALRRAVQLAPGNAGAWNNLGTVLAQRAKPNDAIGAFQHALTLDPLHQGARVSLAQQYLAIGSAPRARALLEEVLATNPSMAEAHYALGQACELERDWAGAVRAYGNFVRVAPAALGGAVERVQQRIQLLSVRVQ